VLNDVAAFIYCTYMMWQPSYIAHTKAADRSATLTAQTTRICFFTGCGLFLEFWSTQMEWMNLMW